MSGEGLDAMTSLMRIACAGEMAVGTEAVGKIVSPLMAMVADVGAPEST